MRELYIIYDGRCGICCQIKTWLEREPSYLPLRLLPSGSEQVLRLFPAIPREDLVVVADTGEAWYGDNAFILTLWALKAYRRWAIRLSAPALRPFARRAYAALSSGRFVISQLLRLDSNRLAAQLQTVVVPACELRENDLWKLNQ
jgi:predicted DCC family thiol-disulfide oxidoreductase YuxK